MSNFSARDRVLEDLSQLGYAQAATGQPLQSLVDLAKATYENRYGVFYAMYATAEGSKLLAQRYGAGPTSLFMLAASLYLQTWYAGTAGAEVTNAYADLKNTIAAYLPADDMKVGELTLNPNNFLDQSGILQKPDVQQKVAALRKALNNFGQTMWGTALIPFEIAGVAKVVRADAFKNAFPKLRDSFTSGEHRVSVPNNKDVQGAIGSLAATQDAPIFTAELPNGELAILNTQGMSNEQISAVLEAWKAMGAQASKVNAYARRVSTDANGQQSYEVDRYSIDGANQSKYRVVDDDGKNGSPSDGDNPKKPDAITKKPSEHKVGGDVNGGGNAGGTGGIVNSNATNRGT
ncbi:MAG: hypothetical protein ACRDAM_20555, partial [Casimicrobium sp.]